MSNNDNNTTTAVTGISTNPNMTKAINLNQSTTKPLGFFKDDVGDFSSGRLIKIGSFITAIGLAIASVWLSKDLTALITIFMGVATATQISQNITGK